MQKKMKDKIIQRLLDNKSITVKEAMILMEKEIYISVQPTISSYPNIGPPHSPTVPPYPYVTCENPVK